MTFRPLTTSDRETTGRCACLGSRINSFGSVTMRDFPVTTVELTTVDFGCNTQLASTKTELLNTRPLLTTGPCPLLGWLGGVNVSLARVAASVVRAGAIAAMHHSLSGNGLHIHSGLASDSPTFQTQTLRIRPTYNGAVGEASRILLNRWEHSYLPTEHVTDIDVLFGSGAVNDVFTRDKQMLTCTV